MSQNKKRKQSPTIYSNRHDEKLLDFDDQNIESVLFDEMTTVNSKLISLGNNFKLVDNLYFMNNNNMIDEFIGNMQQFMKQLELYRNKVAFSNNINSDILSHVYQFLDTTTLINCCGLVSKLWKESLTGLKVQVRSTNIANFLDSSLVNNVTKLRLKAINLNVLISLSNSSNITRLKKLDLSDNKLDSECIEYLMKCNMPNLTKLNLKYSKVSEKDVIELFNSNFMSNIKKIDLSRTIQDFTNNFYESFAESKYLNQITHLIMEGGKIKPPGDLLLKNKFNLEYLELVNYDLSHCTNLLINGNYKNLKYLDILCCYIKNQEFVNLLMSPNLPNLETVKVYYLREDDKAVFPPNSQSSITELYLQEFKAEQFPSLFNHCPKLKRLNVWPRKVDKEFLQMMKSPVLSNLERLHISQIEIVEEVFNNPIYSNLKVLELAECELNSDYVKFFTNCTNLLNLTTLDMSDVYVDDDRSLAVINVEACSKALTNNPTFSNLKHIKLPPY